MTLFRAVAVSLIAACLLAGGVTAQEAKNTMPLIQPAELAQILKSSAAQRPLLLQVGFRVLYASHHIPAAEYAGPASDEGGLKALRARVNSLPRKTFIVLYCGCCPWTHCPNVHPAFAALQSMGFTNVKVLYLADNFRTDWMDKGYPVEK